MGRFIARLDKDQPGYRHIVIKQESGTVPQNRHDVTIVQYGAKVVVEIGSGTYLFSYSMGVNDEPNSAHPALHP
jgi:hypothetical protein